MNKNIFKIVILVITVLAIVVGTMYLIDLNKMKNGEEVVFSTWGAKYAPILKEQQTEERTKLKDLKIKADGIDTTKLVRFNDTLYGKSYALIDYAGDMSKSMGKIDYLIEKEYLPIINGETNCQEFYGSDVLEVNEKSMVLNVDNEAVLFEKIDRENIKEK